MSVLTDALSAEVRRHVRTLYGQVLTRPALLVTDGIEIIYACDVNIGPVDPTGRFNQFVELNEEGNPDVDEEGNAPGSSLTGLPGQPIEDFQLDDTLYVNTVLHNVTIARGNEDLIYADVGSPVRLDRTFSGLWEITGFSQEMPGTLTFVPVNLWDEVVGTIIDVSLTTRLLDLGEFGTLRPFGALPFGASAIFVGGVLQSIV